MYNYHEIIKFAYNLGIPENDAACIASAAAQECDDLLQTAVQHALGLFQAAVLELLESFEKPMR